LGTRTTAGASQAPPVVMLDYHRTGGIAGIDDRLVIFDNGAAMISTKSVSREFLVNQSELLRLNNLFGQAQFDSLEGTYTSRGGEDFLHYSITYNNRTVITEDTATPSSLQPIITEMNAVIAHGSAENLMTGSFAGFRT
ncbi:MAG: hypothetical protein PHT99_06780, partial [Methanoregula sp.]|nr:hypothetical protein [Methanoregula sp.]